MLILERSESCIEIEYHKIERRVGHICRVYTWNPKSFYVCTVCISNVEIMLKTEHHISFAEFYAEIILS